MEQEYEAILNNLNLEQMPKDEALLTVLKQILDTITFFRIQEGDKRMLEKSYQQKVKNAIWSAVPSINVFISGGQNLSVGSVVSVLSVVGTSYMNYRRVKAEINLEYEQERWELERSAIEQFNGLRRELFDTAWRLSSAYLFPDQLRLTERQIKQYNAILMDDDLIRKYNRLETIREAFIAYPPFWYYFGNTANAIAHMDVPLREETRMQYRQLAKEHFHQYRKSNQYSLLREDPIAASCALELVELLDFNTDQALIQELLQEAVRCSGRANDVLQLAAVGYLKLHAHEQAAVLLQQLVNEQYNTVLNAQLLSAIYVNDYIQTKNPIAWNRHELLQNQVGQCYVYPMPHDTTQTMAVIESQFILSQKNVLRQKYEQVINAFINQCEMRFLEIVPMPDGAERADYSHLGHEYACQVKLHQLKKTFAQPRQKHDYIAMLQEAGVLYSFIELLNELFQECCVLDVMTETVQVKLARHIEQALLNKKDRLNDIADKIDVGDVTCLEVEELLAMCCTNFIGTFFEELQAEIGTYIDSRRELQDFAIAEENLAEFCSRTELPDPAVLFDTDGEQSARPLALDVPHFGIELIKEGKQTLDDELSEQQEMLTLIKSMIPRIVMCEEVVELFTNEDPRRERYFRGKEKLRTNNLLMASTLAILDDKTNKGDYDLLFTWKGIVAVKDGSAKKTIPYDAVIKESGDTPLLIISGKFENDAVDLDALFELIQRLKKFAKPAAASKFSFKLPALKDSVFHHSVLKHPVLKNPFAKKDDANS